jgi:adenosylmethionine-8-amino-7-oxononanoate aminotransferase
MIWAFEVCGAGPDFPRAASALAMKAHALLRPIGDTVYFMPPYVAGEEEFAILVEAGLAIADELGTAA